MISALIVPVLNRPDLLQRMLLSIDHPVGDLLVIDNGRVVEALPPLPTVDRAHLLRMPTNLGVPGSWNLGIKSLPFAPWWLIVNSDAWFPAGSLAAMSAVARRDALVLSGAMPPWACFALGDIVVKTVGIFDEFIQPCYFEDNDYERRVRHAGLEVIQTGVSVHHDNSSTIASDAGLAHANNRTFSLNAAYYQDKVNRGDYGEGRWSLARRRDLSWD